MSNVTFLIDSLQTGGAEKSLLEITSRLKRYSPTFIQIFKGDELKPLFEQAGIKVISLDLSPSYEFKGIAKRILPYLKEIKPVIIHSTLFRSDMIARELKKLTGLPLINSLVNNSYSKHRYLRMSLLGKAKLFGIQQWDKFTATQVDLFIANSETIKSTNAAAISVDKNSIQVVYRGRDAEAFKINSDSLEKIKHQLNPFSKNVFLNVSRLLDRKGQLDLINAFKIVQDKYPETILLIAGDGSYRSILEKRINELQISEHVKLLGNRKDVLELLKLANYFVFPSHYEGLPGVLIEAMFAGTPIIASAIPENKECVNENMALLFDRGDVNELAKQMCEAMELKDWSAKTLKAKHHAIENFEINSIAAQYEKLYDQLLAQ